jgi:hypothetical protein
MRLRCAMHNACVKEQMATRYAVSITRQCWTLQMPKQAETDGGAQKAD